MRSILACEPEFKLVGFVSQAGMLEDIARRHQARLVIIDSLGLRAPQLVGTIESVKKSGSEVLAVIPSSNWSLAVKTIDAGASGVVHRAGSSPEMITAIKRLLDAEHYLHPDLKRVFHYNARLGSGIDKRKLSMRLNRIEQRVLKLISIGKNEEDIARQMKMSLRCVSEYRQRICETVGCDNTARLTRVAMKIGLD